ncbi:hypothetical protein ABPG72_016049 [Tetrahymena utriculariae]
MGSINTVARWAFVPSPTDPKHLKYPHAIFSCFLGFVSTILLSGKIQQLIEDKYPHLKEGLPKWAGDKALPVLVAYLVLMMIVRIKQNGSTSIYEMLWACNLAIVMMICGILSNSALTVGASLVIISIDQCLWYVDILGYLLAKKFPVGVAKYLTWPTTTKLRMLTSTHHLWFIPLLISILKGSKQLTHQAYFFSFAMTLFQSILGRVLVPRYIKQKKGEDIYMNINLAYELWKDVKIKLLASFDQAPGYKAVPFSNFCWNSGNYIFFLILKLILLIIRTISPNNQ